MCIQAWCVRLIGFLNVMGFFFLAEPAFAWNALGHMVIADIAYQRLNPLVKEKVDTLVFYLQQDYPTIRSFAQMAAWPDTLRGQKTEVYTHWHYKNIEFSLDGTPLPGLMNSDDATKVLPHIKSLLADKSQAANPHEQARFLAFLVHIVGDLHQPLHTVTEVSSRHPLGDRGGNDYVVYYQGNPTHLHSLWDSGVGYFRGRPTARKANFLARKITFLFPPTYFGLQKSENEETGEWTKEGLKNAQTEVYTTPENAPVKPDYIHNGQVLAQKEAALAGYRLSRILNELLSPN